MEFQEVIIKRRTIRDFSDKPIDKQIINTALHAGLHAPSYNYLKRRDFVLVKDLEVRVALTKTEEMIKDYLSVIIVAGCYFYV